MVVITKFDKAMENIKGILDWEDTWQQYGWWVWLQWLFGRHNEEHLVENTESQVYDSDHGVIIRTKQ